jgi:hypothetical protein
MFADNDLANDVTIQGCGFRLYCGFDDWFIGEGGFVLLLVVGALLAKRWRDLPLVTAVALLGPVATAYLIGAPGLMLYRPTRIDLILSLVIVAAIASVVYALKRLVLYALRPKPTPA